MFPPEHYRALRDDAGLLDRSDRSRLRLTGADRRSYLQGLLTNDIVALTPGTGCYAAILTPQGRMIADMRVLETGEEILLDLPGPAGQTVFDRLEGFVFSEDVQVADVTASLAQLGVFGPRAGAVLSRAFAEEGSDGPAGVQRFDDMRLYENVWLPFGGGRALVVRSDEIGVAGFEVLLDVGARESLRAAMIAAGAVELSETATEVCRIEAGRPAFGRDMHGDTIPLEAGIEDRAISQTKGCYVGQEIIIRVLHRGHGRVARRLVGLALDHGAPTPGAGDVIRAGERQIGAVTSAALSAALDRPIALGYVHRDFTEPGTEVHIGETGARAVVSALPFVPQPEPSATR